MKFPKLGLLGLAPEENGSKRHGYHDRNQLEVVEPVGQHIEGLVRSDPHQEQIDAIGHHEDSRLQVTRTKSDEAQLAQLFVVVEEPERVDWQDVLFHRVLATDEFGIPRVCIGIGICRLRPSRADHLPGQRVDLVLPRDYYQVSSQQSLFGLADEDVLDR